MPNTAFPDSGTPRMSRLAVEPDTLDRLALAVAIGNALRENYPLPSYSSKASRHTISNLPRYILGVAWKSACSDSALVSSFLLVKNIEERFPGIINSVNVGHIHLACLTVASKFFDDRFKSNQAFANFGCVSLKLLNSFEIEVLIALNFGLIPNAFEFAATRVELENSVSQSQIEEVCTDFLGNSKLQVPQTQFAFASPARSEEAIDISETCVNLDAPSRHVFSLVFNRSIVQVRDCKLLQ